MMASLLFLLILGMVQSIPMQRNDQCSYTSCPPYDPNVLNVHIVPHTHDDVGWLKTVDQYYYGSRNNIQKAGVQYIIDSVVKELLQDSTRRFIYVETAFFWKWWVHQSEETQSRVKQLVSEGRLEFVGGAWSMNDEAASHYQSTIDQFTWGLSKLSETFGSCALPRVGWQIDPFGHSREFASLLAGMGYDGLFLGRIDYEDKRKRLRGKEMEMVWRGDDDLGSASDIFTGVNYNTYSPPPGFCFDVLCSDEPIIDDMDSPMYNVEHKISMFIDYVRNQARAYATNNIMITMGGDFTYQDAAMWYKNLDKLILYTNLKAAKEGITLKLYYSTPNCYLKAVRKANPTLPTKSDDFFPYASDPNSFWTGYFTSRPTTKYFERRGNAYLQSVKQLQVLSNLEPSVELDQLKSAMGIMQHHDAITGTEKQHVANDYVRILDRAVEDGLRIIRLAFNKLQAGDSTKAPIFKMDRCRLNESSCPTSENSDRFVVTLYNPIAWKTSEPVRLPVPEGQLYDVYAPDGNKIASQISKIAIPILGIPSRHSKATFELIFIAHLKPLEFKSYYITKREKENRKTKRDINNNTKNKVNQDFIIYDEFFDTNHKEKLEADIKHIEDIISVDYGTMTSLAETSTTETPLFKNKGKIIKYGFDSNNKEEYTNILDEKPPKIDIDNKSNDEKPLAKTSTTTQTPLLKKNGNILKYNLDAINKEESTNILDDKQSNIEIDNKRNDDKPLPETSTTESSLLKNNGNILKYNLDSMNKEEYTNILDDKPSKIDMYSKSNDDVDTLLTLIHPHVPSNKRTPKMMNIDRNENDNENPFGNNDFGDEFKMLGDDPMVVDRLLDYFVMENEHIKIHIDNTSGEIKSIQYPHDSINVSINFLYYPAAIGNNEIPSNRSSGAYIFRPNATEPTSLGIKSYQLIPGNVVTEYQVIWHDNAYFSARLYKGLNYIEIDWLVGPIDVTDGVGKEYVVRYKTSILHDGIFYTDSNGRQVLKRTLNQRPQYNVSLEEPVGGNYYPVTNEIFIQDYKNRYTVMTDRAQGGSSLNEGNVELMLQRRLLHDDAFGVGEALNEEENGMGLMVRGTHRIMITPSKDGRQKELENIYKLHLQPLVFVSEVNSLTLNDWLKIKNPYSWLKTPLPDGIHLLTLEPWGEHILIRLENILTKADGATEVVDLSILLNNVHIKSIKETDLAGNEIKEKWSWNKVMEFERDEEDAFRDKGFIVNIKPKQIRTFILEYDIV